MPWAGPTALKLPRVAVQSLAVVLAVEAPPAGLARWRKEIRRLFEAGHSIEEIAAVAGVRYDVVLAIVRPR